MHKFLVHALFQIDIFKKKKKQTKFFSVNLLPFLYGEKGKIKNAFLTEIIMEN